MAGRHLLTVALYSLQVAVMYGLVDASGEYDEEAVQALQEQLAEAAGQQVTPTATPTPTLPCPKPNPAQNPPQPLHLPLPLIRRSSVTARSTT